MKKNDLVLDVEDKPKLGQWLMLSVQHVFAMFGATVLVPITVNQAAGYEVISISTALLASGIGTTIYIVCTKAKSPVYLGSSFAFIAGISAVAAAYGSAAVYTALMGVGIVYVIFALMILLIGNKWIDYLLPPIIVGPMIIVIGLGLAPVAIAQIGMNGSASWQSLLVAFVALMVTACAAILGKGFFKIIPFLVGIVAGYLTAIAVGLVDFQPVLDASWLAIPKMSIPFVSYQLDFRGLLTLLPISIVTLAEHIGDHTVLSQIINRPLLKDPGLHRTLLGDGLGTFASAMIGGPANTTYGENTSVIGLSKVASIYVIGGAALFAMLISFVGKFAALIGSIPTPVFGGVSILLFGFIASNGIRVLVENQIDFASTKNVVVASTMLVFGLGGAMISISLGDVSLTLTGMVLAAVAGIVLNSFFNALVKDGGEESEGNH